jgi:hypothetical protein
LAGVRKTAFVRIGVTGSTAIERKIRVPRLALCIRDMALLASNVGVCASQRILGLGVIEGCRRFPVLEIVAALAIGSKPSLVLIAMATATLG